MALAAKSNGTQSLDDSIQRTKILLLGQQGSVSPLLTHVRSPSSILPRAEVERPPSSSSFSTTYPRNKPSFSNPRLEQLNIHTIRSSPWRYGIVRATSPLIPSALLCQNFLRSFSSLTYRCLSSSCISSEPSASHLSHPGFLSAADCAHA
jgi:hypothetical protein